jgi:hypothetical protein
MSYKNVARIVKSAYFPIIVPNFTYCWIMAPTNLTMRFIPTTDVVFQIIHI